MSPQSRATSNGQSLSTETVTSSYMNLNSTQAGGDSTTVLSLPPVQAYSGQAYASPPTVTPPDAPPATLVGTTSESQTIPQASEPVSLPEAMLHQGDALPGYAEAI